MSSYPWGIFPEVVAKRGAVISLKRLKEYTFPSLVPTIS